MTKMSKVCCNAANSSTKKVNRWLHLSYQLNGLYALNYFLEYYTIPECFIWQSPVYLKWMRNDNETDEPTRSYLSTQHLKRRMTMWLIDLECLWVRSGWSHRYFLFKGALWSYAYPITFYPTQFWMRQQNRAGWQYDCSAWNIFLPLNWYFIGFLSFAWSCSFDSYFSEKWFNPFVRLPKFINHDGMTLIVLQVITFVLRNFNEICASKRIVEASLMPLFCENEIP